MACELWPYDLSCLPADWPTDPLASIEQLVAEMTIGQRSAYDMAVELLSKLTLGVFGMCSRTARPCSAACARIQGLYLGRGGWFTPYLQGGQVYNGCGCEGPRLCVCGDERAQVALAGPVAEVVEVVVDGEVVDPGVYVTANGSLLVRVDGGVWPLRQNLNRPLSEPDTFGVTYLQGTPVPAGGRRALSALMVELDKARCGDASCRLPSKVTNIVREGVTYSMLDDPTALLDAGRTGVSEVDMWLAAVNPHGTRTRLAVYSPDIGRRR